MSAKCPWWHRLLFWEWRGTEIRGPFGLHEDRWIDIHEYYCTKCKVRRLIEEFS
jgi:hypothetical protein